jgi:hypothetical protein
MTRHQGCCSRRPVGAPIILGLRLGGRGLGYVDTRELNILLFMVVVVLWGFTWAVGVLGWLSSASSASAARETIGEPNRTRSSGAPWMRLPSWFSVTTQLFAVLAIVIYGTLYIGDDNFYEQLGVTPSAVGANYVDILQNSVGVLLVVFLFVALFVGGYVVGIFALSAYFHVRRRRHAESLTDLLVVRVLCWTLLLIGVVYVGDVATIVLQKSDEGVALVRAGEPVIPGRFFGAQLLTLESRRVVVVPVGASPVTGVAGKSLARSCSVSGLTDLGGRVLMYLGQANGQYVLYMPHCDKVIYVPAAQVVLIVNASN